MFMSNMTKVVRCDGSGRPDASGRFYKFVSYADGMYCGKSFTSEDSKPFVKDGSLVEYLGDKALTRLVGSLIDSYETEPTTREAFDAFISEYCVPRPADVVGALYFDSGSPDIYTFNLVRNDYGSVLAYNEQVREAFFKVDQKNIPYDQAVHALEDPFAQIATEIGKDVPKTAFVQKDMGHSVTSAIRDLGWVVMVYNGYDYEFMP